MERERLTERNRIGKAIVKYAELQALIDRLAAYEDSGLTPEEVMELSKIVRCGECMYYEKEDCPMNDFFETRKNAFCSYGERKEKEGK